MVQHVKASFPLNGSEQSRFHIEYLICALQKNIMSRSGKALCMRLWIVAASQRTEYWIKWSEKGILD